MGFFARTFQWLHMAFPPSLGGSQLPRQLGEFINLTTEIFGTERFGNIEGEVVTGTAGQNRVLGTLVPAGKIRIVPYAHVTHNDAAAQDVNLLIEKIIGATTFRTAISAVTNTVANLKRHLERPVIIPSEGRLIGESQAAPVASIIIQYLYFEVPAGEYVRYFS